MSDNDDAIRLGLIDHLGNILVDDEDRSQVASKKLEFISINLTPSKYLGAEGKYLRAKLTNDELDTSTVELEVLHDKFNDNDPLALEVYCNQVSIGYIRKVGSDVDIDKYCFIDNRTKGELTIEWKNNEFSLFKVVDDNAKTAEISATSIEPALIKIPAGRFDMGCDSDQSNADERPVHSVNISTFYLSKTVVTFEQYDAYVASGDCNHVPDDEGWGRGDRPVINVSFDDVQNYIQWLNKQTGQSYRLPSEAEWEYAARAGSKTEYSWGNELGTNKTNGGDSGSKWSGKQTAPVGSFEANAFGLQDMHGNVWEWVQDWYGADAYSNSATNDPKGLSSGRYRVLRGGGWDFTARNLRSANRSNNPPGSRYYSLGFRLVRQP